MKRRKKKKRNTIRYTHPLLKPSNGLPHLVDVIKAWKDSVRLTNENAK